jgi:hypothetical protein
MIPFKTAGGDALFRDRTSARDILIHLRLRGAATPSSVPGARFTLMLLKLRM